MKADEWIERFARELARLGLQAPPTWIDVCGFRFWRTAGDRCPEDVARAEFESWPSRDRLAS
jgi:hypothetical protein